MKALEALERVAAAIRSRQPERDAYYILNEVLKEHGVNKPLLFEIEDELVEEALRVAERYSAGEPIQYIFKRAYFMELELEVWPGVFIPRPETELLVYEAERLFPPRAKIKILDVGTGTGCIAIALARRYPNAQVVATDISDRALEVARRNAARYGVQIEFLKKEGVKGLGGFDIALSNPPYVRTEEMEGLDKWVKREPPEALWGGDDGLRLAREILEEAPGKWVLLETSPFVAEELLKLAGSLGYKAEIIPDYSGFPRVLKASREVG